MVLSIIMGIILIVIGIAYFIIKKIKKEKAYKNTTLNKTHGNVIFYFIMATFIVLGSILYIKIIIFNNEPSDLAKNWQNIKGDFEVINEIVIDYFENNNFNAIDVYEFKKTLNNEQLAAFERAGNNYTRYGDYGGTIQNITFHDGIIEYYDWENYGQFEKIVYSKYTKKELKKIYNKGEIHFVIEELGDNWYYLDEHHL